MLKITKVHKNGIGRELGLEAGDLSTRKRFDPLYAQSTSGQRHYALARVLKLYGATEKKGNCNSRLPFPFFHSV